MSFWARRAEQVTAWMSGKTPALLIETLLETPALSASMAARACSCDKATARRNLNGSVANFPWGREIPNNR